MIQYNLSLFFEPSIHESAIRALKTVIMPEIEKQDFIDQIFLFEITSHQEPDSVGYSLQCWYPPSRSPIRNLLKVLFQVFSKRNSRISLCTFRVS
jgi:hypothetical protein